MEMRLARLIVNKSGSGSSTFRATLPTKWIRSMGLDEETRDIKLELIDNKIIISKEGLTMLDFGEFKLKEVEESEIFYIATLDTNIIVTKNKRDLSQYKRVGKLKVYHDGNYFGTPEEMDEWLREKVIDHLIEKEHLVEDGETVMGESLWKLA